LRFKHGKMVKKFLNVKQTNAGGAGNPQACSIETSQMTGINLPADKSVITGYNFFSHGMKILSGSRDIEV
jgi:hypothetical protein